MKGMLGLDNERCKIWGVSPCSQWICQTPEAPAREIYGQRALPYQDEQ